MLFYFSMQQNKSMKSVLLTVSIKCRNLMSWNEFTAPKAKPTGKTAIDRHATSM